MLPIFGEFGLNNQGVSHDFFQDCLQYKPMRFVCWQLVYVRPACAFCDGSHQNSLIASPKINQLAAIDNQLIKDMGQTRRGN